MSGGWATPWAGGDPEVGETFIQGKDQPTARGLLAAADALSLDRNVVRTVTGGFIVPNEVFDRYTESKNQAEGLDF